MPDSDDLGAIQARIDQLQAIVNARASQSATSTSNASPLHQQAAAASAPIGEYSSLRNLARGHPPATSASDASHFILGQAQLGVSMQANRAQPRLPSVLGGVSRAVISDANNRRNDAIATHFPCQPSLPVRPRRSATTTTSSSASGAVTQRRPRGPRVHEPTLADAAALNPTQPLLIGHMPGAEDDLHISRRYRGSYLDRAGALGLVHTYQLPSNTAVADVLATAASDMRNHRAAWEFGAPPAELASVLRPAELQPLQLLRIKNKRGGPHTNNVYRLEPIPHSELGLRTLRTLVGDKRFAAPEVTVQERRLDIHFLIALPDATCINAVGSGDMFRHESECTIDRFNTDFSLDVERGNTQTYAAPPCTCVPNAEDSESDIELGEVMDMDILGFDDDANDHDYTPAAPSPTPAPSRLTRQSDAANRIDIDDVFSLTPASATAAAAPVPPTVAAAVPLFEPYSPPTGQYAAIFRASNVHDAMVREATRGGIGLLPFNVTVASVREGGLHYLQFVGRQALENDFSSALVPGQQVMIRREDNEGYSTGDGTLRDVHSSAWQFILKPEFVTPKVSNHFSIAISSPSTDPSIFSSKRILTFKTLGAMCAIAMANGVAPEMVEVGLLWFAMHGGDRRCFQRPFLAEFYPTVLRVLEDLQSAGVAGPLPTNVVQHLASYHELDAASLTDRTPALQASLLADIPLVCIVSPKGIDNPEVKAFVDGFQLSMRNGFKITDVMHSHPGGAIGFLESTLLSVIHDTSSLHSKLRVQISDGTATLAGVSASSIVIDDILVDFLRGSGVPSQQALDAAMRRIHPLVKDQLNRVDEASFRPRMFCWATTGTTQIRDGEEMVVRWVMPDDANAYHPSSRNAEGVRESMLAGKCSFRTCFKKAFIPVLHLDLLLRSSSFDHGITSVDKAIENWLFIEILEAIGGHGFL
ncbi:hypothetical protein MKEN_01504100 [Mycena kentingensis (nom. inval.)]|nr:hypothetical protein MKEN_01504100 [Mycena kentingensis (nom. inval.)]